ncbi:hypothetical protein HDV57DRAFT_72104 [Trichoderma longibrachiatum]
MGTSCGRRHGAGHGAPELELRRGPQQLRGEISSCCIMDVQSYSVASAGTCSSFAFSEALDSFLKRPREWGEIRLEEGCLEALVQTLQPCQAACGCWEASLATTGIIAQKSIRTATDKTRGKLYCCRSPQSALSVDSRLAGGSLSIGHDAKKTTARHGEAWPCRSRGLLKACRRSVCTVQSSRVAKILRLVSSDTIALTWAQH